jgi:DNA-binding NarL/FixJ family response regulator
VNIRVLVADDQPLVRAGIAALLAAQPGFEVVAEVSCGEDIVKAAATHLPDVVVMELLMPDCAGLDVIGQVVADGLRYSPHRPVRVLAMTTEHHPRRAYAALRAGADGFLLKTRPPEILTAAIRTVAVAGTWLDTAVVRDMLVELASRPATGESVSTLIRRLTAREREVLLLLSHGLGNTEIADRLFLSEATVRTHVGRILMKLDCRDRTRAVVVAYRSGLVRVSAGEAAA